MGKGHVRDALGLAGNQHRYQKILVVVLTLAWITMMIVLLSPTLIYMDPLFQCANPFENSVHEKQACQKINECIIEDDFTLVADTQLYCEKNWQRIFIQSIFSLGSFIGILVINTIADTNGRRIAILGSISISIVSLLATLYGGKFNNVFYMMLGQFLAGFAVFSIMPLAYTLASDFMSDKLRPKALAMLNCSDGIAAIFVGTIYFLRLNWFDFILYFQLLPFAVLFIAFYLFLEESPYILMNHGKVDQTKKVLYVIAKWNGHQQNFPVIKRIIEQQDIKEPSKRPSLDNVTKKLIDWRYLKMILLLIVINIVSNLNYFGISYSFAQQGFGFGYNSIMMGFVQFGAVFFLTWTVSNVPRRLGIAVFYFLTMMTQLIFLSDFVRNSLAISTILIGVARIFALNGYCLLACSQTQAFTVSIQSTAGGLIEGFGIIGGFIAPFVVQMAESLQVSPISMCALFITFAIISAYFMRETLIPQHPWNKPLITSAQRIQLLKHVPLQMEMHSLTTTEKSVTSQGTPSLNQNESLCKLNMKTMASLTKQNSIGSGEIESQSLKLMKSDGSMQ